jgi:hypothetical protein
VVTRPASPLSAHARRASWPMLPFQIVRHTTKGRIILPEFKEFSFFGPKKYFEEKLSVFFFETNYPLNNEPPASMLCFRTLPYSLFLEALSFFLFCRHLLFLPIFLLLRTVFLFPGQWMWTWTHISLHYHGGISYAICTVSASVLLVVDAQLTESSSFWTFVLCVISTRVMENLYCFKSSGTTILSVFCILFLKI